MPVVSDDLVMHLRAEADAHADGDWNDQVIRRLFTEAADEIERLNVWRKDALLALDKRETIIATLTADLAAERALADQLADALRWQADPHQTGTLGITHKALDAYEEARRER